jgi:outer membrane protein TolC
MNLAGWQIDLAQAELKKSNAGALPTISFRVEKQYGSYLGSLAPGSRVYLNSQFSMGAGLTALPLQEQALARAKSAELQAYSSSLTLATQVQRLWHDRSQAWEKILTIQGQLKLQKELADAGIRLFTGGRRSWQDLLGLQRELYQLQASESEAQAAYLAADWRIHLLANTLPMFSFPSN